MNTAAIESLGYKNLPLAMLDESSTNPRALSSRPSWSSLPTASASTASFSPSPFAPRGIASRW